MTADRTPGVKDLYLKNCGGLKKMLLNGSIK
jgi:hypothetical protein